MNEHLLEFQSFPGRVGTILNRVPDIAVSLMTNYRPQTKLQKGNQWRIQDFPKEGAPTPRGGAPTYEFAKFSQKLHEIERIWTPRGGGARPSRPPLRSATGNVFTSVCQECCPQVGGGVHPPGRYSTSTPWADNPWEDSP